MQNNNIPYLNTNNKYNTQVKPNKSHNKETMREKILKLDQNSLIPLVTILIEYRASRVEDNNNLDLKSQFLTLLEDFNLSTNNSFQYTPEDLLYFVTNSSRFSLFKTSIPHNFNEVLKYTLNNHKIIFDQLSLNALLFLEKNGFKDTIIHEKILNNNATASEKNTILPQVQQSRRRNDLENTKTNNIHTINAYDRQFLTEKHGRSELINCNTNFVNDFNRRGTCYGMTILYNMSKNDEEYLQTILYLINYSRYSRSLKLVSALDEEMQKLVYYGIKPFANREVIRQGIIFMLMDFEDYISGDSEPCNYPEKSLDDLLSIIKNLYQYNLKFRNFISQKDRFSIVEYFIYFYQFGQNHVYTDRMEFDRTDLNKNKENNIIIFSEIINKIKVSKKYTLSMLTKNANTGHTVCLKKETLYDKDYFQLFDSNNGVTTLNDINDLEQDITSIFNNLLIALKPRFEKAQENVYIQLESIPSIDDIYLLAINMFDQIEKPVMITDPNKVYRFYQKNGKTYIEFINHPDYSVVINYKNNENKQIIKLMYAYGENPDLLLPKDQESKVKIIDEATLEELKNNKKSPQDVLKKRATNIYIMHNKI